jgi:predicted secreted protein
VVAPAALVTPTRANEIKMNWVSGVVLYILIWWVTLFAVLPIGTHAVEQPDETSGWRGAPARPRIWTKVGLTTLVACVVWAVAFAVIESGWISFREGYFASPKD